MTRTDLIVIACALLLAAFVWVGVAHLDEMGAARSKRSTADRQLVIAGQKAILANLKALTAHEGVVFTEPVQPPAR